MKTNLEIRKEKVGKNDKTFDFVAVVNAKGNVITAATFASEDDADSAIKLLETLLSYESYPCTPYERLRDIVDVFFKKVADGKDPIAFDKDYDDENETLFEMPKIDTGKKIFKDIKKQTKACANAE